MRGHHLINGSKTSLELESGTATLKADFTNVAKITAFRQNPLQVVLSEEETGLTKFQLDVIVHNQNPNSQEVQEGHEAFKTSLSSSGFKPSLCYLRPYFK